MNNEAFFKDLGLNSITTLKPRVSWGILGNDSALGYYMYEASYQQVNYHGFNGIKQSGFTSVKVINENIKWEEMHTIDAGLDLGMFSNKLNINADWYRRETKDMIYNIPIPQSTGIALPNREPSMMPVNIGSIMNKGWEVSISYRNNIGNLKYNISGNISHNENEVLNLGLDNASIAEGGTWPMSDHSSLSRTMEGYPIGQIWGFKTDGLLKNQEEMDELNRIAVEKGGQYWRNIN